MFNRNLAITNCFRKNEEAGPNQKQCSVVDVSGGEMAAHSSTLAWKIPCTEEPGGLQSMGALLDTCLVVTCQELDFPFTFHFHALEKEMATHSSVLAWRIPGMGEPGGLPFMHHTKSDTTKVT